ncbi:transporter substrate-binding domain-containing protein [Roseibium denhamense]|uniref:Amino acid ABC transporter substrate-binding protein, PAAT family n=1 Tax=Roseibium denhamense TaxID=76305 RepID=A0ABY1NA92_9HYPH|nr:transporter substrate-binding domain-containing protein [Roseibium denhamense]MTI06519.1 transporter substrate-binding domain-containing protein [Roseibium denhamense]SMP04516.1 amino acid ABC transporter substrate-binding protein, PAAT family [Roseibium denhamense]
MKFGQIVSAAVLALGLTTAAKAETLQIGVGEWAPYIGEALPDQGLHTKRVMDVLNAAGYNDLELVFQPWKRSYEVAKRGDYVATFSWSHSDEREADFIYPEVPLEEQTDVIFYSKAKHPDGISATSIEDIKAQGLQVVGLAGYWYESALKDAGVDIHIVSSEDNAWKFLQAGRADIMIENEVVGGLSVENILGADASDIGKGAVLRTVPMYVMFSKAHPEAEAMAKAWDANAK